MRRLIAQKRAVEKARGVAARAAWMVIAGALWLSDVAGCIVTESRCGANQQLLEDNDGICVCTPNAVASPKGYGCDRCEENELVRANKCECMPGFARADATAPCTPSATSTLGQTCSEAQPCTEPFPYCASAGGESYCTTIGCKTSEQCPEDYLCRSDGTIRFCGKVPGMLRACAVPADCAGTEATYCETIQAKVCLVAQCATSGLGCPSGWSCCDLSRFIQTSLCIRTSLLDDGKCLDGQAPVIP